MKFRLSFIAYQDIMIILFHCRDDRQPQPDFGFIFIYSEARKSLNQHQWLINYAKLESIFDKVRRRNLFRTPSHFHERNSFLWVEEKQEYLKISSLSFFECQRSNLMANNSTQHTNDENFYDRSKLHIKFNLLSEWIRCVARLILSLQIEIDFRLPTKHSHCGNVQKIADYFRSVEQINMRWSQTFSNWLDCIVIHIHLLWLN